MTYLKSMKHIKFIAFNYIELNIKNIQNKEQSEIKSFLQQGLIAQSTQDISNSNNITVVIKEQNDI